MPHDVLRQDVPDALVGLGREQPQNKHKPFVIAEEPAITDQLVQCHRSKLGWQATHPGDVLESRLSLGLRNRPRFNRACDFTRQRDPCGDRNLGVADVLEQITRDLGFPAGAGG